MKVFEIYNPTWVGIPHYRIFRVHFFLDRAFKQTYDLFIEEIGRM